MKISHFFIFYRWNTNLHERIIINWQNKKESMTYYIRDWYSNLKYIYRFFILLTFTWRSFLLAFKWSAIKNQIFETKIRIVKHFFLTYEKLDYSQISLIRILIKKTEVAHEAIFFIVFSKFGISYGYISANDKKNCVYLFKLNKNSWLP